MPISGSKLDLIMNLTGTSNGELGKALSFDTSYISRIRAGKRGIPRHQPFVEPAGLFFAEKLENNALLQSVAGFLISKDTPWPADRETAAARIASWLRFDIVDRDKMVGEFLNRFADVELPKPNLSFEDLPLPAKETTPFIGNAGRRRAMDLLLNELLVQEEPGELFFFSDEARIWLTEDAEYYEKWKQKLLAFLMRGGHMKLIHTASSGLGEVVQELQFFLPFYMTGRVEPYYCPVLLDGIFHRTMCISVGRRALISQSVGADPSQSTSFLISNSDTLRATENDYERFLERCRPVMRILDPSVCEELDETQRVYEIGERSIHAGGTPMLGTLPETVIQSLEKRSGSVQFARQLLSCTEMLKEKLESGSCVTELLNLPTLAQIRSGNVSVPFSNAVDGNRITYTPAEFRQHLVELLRMMKQYPRYHVVLTSAVPQNVDLFSAEEATMMVRLDNGGMVFLMQNTRLAPLIWKYLYRFKTKTSRESAQLTLREMISEIEP